MVSWFCSSLIARSPTFLDRAVASMLHWRLRVRHASRRIAVGVARRGAPEACTPGDRLAAARRLRRRRRVDRRPLTPYVPQKLPLYKFGDHANGVRHASCALCHRAGWAMILLPRLAFGATRATRRVCAFLSLCRNLNRDLRRNSSEGNRLRLRLQTCFGKAARRACTFCNPLCNPFCNPLCNPFCNPCRNLRRNPLEGNRLRSRLGAPRGVRRTADYGRRPR